MNRTTTLALTALLFATPVAAQEHGDHATADHGARATAEGMPHGWLMRFDRPAATLDMADFQVMESGWHIRTGRAGAGIYWKPGMTATGDYTVRTAYHLFSPADHAEAFGLFLGGADLGAARQEYLYFLVRQTGEYLIKRRIGGETRNVVGWSRHQAIPVAPAGEQGPTRYDMAVHVADDTVHFVVNGSTVHSLPAAQVETDGVVGLRVNHMLELHIEGLELEHRK